MSTLLRFTLTLAVAAFVASAALAHPVPKDSHDRTIVVRLQKGDAPNRVRLRIEYRVEVDETTVFLNDMREFRDEVNPLDYRGRPMEYYAQFTRIYAPIYADRFIVKVNGKPIEDFRCVSRKERLQDEKGVNLGHLRCDFVYESSFEIGSAEQFTFFFREQNYYLEAGLIHLTVVNETEFAIASKKEPDDALRKRVLEKQDAGDDDRLREVLLVLAPITKKHAEPIGASPSIVDSTPTTVESGARRTRDERFSLLRLIRDTDYGFFLTMLLAVLFGAGHALTPGHGKTLVAAYLVGERGTVWHALYLGIVTTITHTGAVLILATITTFWPSLSWIMNGLGLVMGVIVVCMGFWLLLQRLAGRADHVHLDGRPTAVPKRSLTWWGLTMLGIVGGMVPCWDAVGLYCISIGTGEHWLVLPLLLAFSAGLALVLVVIGILIVQVPRFAESRMGGGAIVRALPIISAVLVILMGFWVCYEAVNGG